MSTAKTGGQSEEAPEPRPAERRPQEPDEWLRLALEATRIGIWGWDVASDRWYPSRTFYTSLGYEPRAAPEDRNEWLERVHRDDRALVLERIQGALVQGHQEHQYEARLRHADGAYRWMLVRGVSVARDENGKVTRLLGVSMDITDRKQAEESLRQSAMLLDATQRMAKIGGWSLDVEQQTSYWTEETYRIHGLDPGTLSPKSSDAIDRSLSCYDPADRHVVLSALDRCIHQGEAYDLELPFTSADGCRKWIRTTASAVREAGRTTKVLGSIMDITDRRRADEQRERTARELAEAQRIAHLGNWNLDLVSNALTWSDEIYRIFEIDPARFGASYEAFLNAIHPDDRDLVNSAYSESVKNRLPYDIVHRLLMEDGRIKYVNEKCETYYADDGAPLRSAGTVHDITERKRAEDEIRQLNQQLEARVVERTAQLEESNRELESFAYSVSHDLRTPLRAIDGYRGLLESRIGSLLDDESRRYLESISRGATRMGRLIDDLLAYSRMGRVGLKREPVDMGALVREIVEELSPLAATRDVRWHIEGLPQATGDRPMLRLVLQNLLSNALKFTATRATARVAVGFREEGAETVFYVRDNGVGFDMQYAGKLFGVFQRLHGVEEFEGLGIGLAKVRRIIDLHGGRIWAEGQVNEGATFCFSLPQCPPGHEARTRPA